MPEPVADARHVCAVMKEISREGVILLCLGLDLWVIQNSAQAELDFSQLFQNFGVCAT